MKRSILIFTFLLVSSAANAAGGTPEDERACGKSAQRFCAKVVRSGDMAVLSCLQQNRTRIARSCQQMLKKYNQ